MSYDLDFRYRRALQPEGLTTIQSALAAVTDAIGDARNAGIDPERDCAVNLLAHHLGTIAATQRSDRPANTQALRDACMAKIAELRSKPAIVVIARRGVGYDPVAKRAFRHEAAKHLRTLAAALGAVPGSFDIAHHGRAASGAESSLTTNDLYVLIKTDLLSAGREIMYKCLGGRTAERHYADIAALVDPDRFAKIIARDLGLDVAPAQPLLSICA